MLGTNMPVPQAKCTVCTDGGCSCFTSSVCSSDSTFFFLICLFCFQSIKASENFRATKHQDKFIQTSSVDSDC